MAGCFFPSSPDSPPLIALISPGAGPLTGGTEITIMGNNFSDVVSVTVGGKELVDLSVVSKDIIEGKTPPGTVGTWDVVVTTAHGSVTKSAAYRYTSKFPIPYGTLNSLESGEERVSAGIVADSSGNVFVAGHTTKYFPGFINMGGTDLFVMKIDNDGELLWVQQLGSDGDDRPEGLALDGDGNVYVVGSSSRSFPGFTSQGNADAYVIKFNGDGARQWVQQLGTAKADYAKAVGTDGDGNIYVVGTTEGSFPDFTNGGHSDTFVMKLGGDGVRQWTRQWGGFGNDSVNGAATDRAGNVYVVGKELNGHSTSGSYVLKFDGTGALMFVKQFESENTRVALDDNGAAYVAGTAGREWQVMKFDGATGAEQWTHPLGLAASAVAGVALEKSGHVYVVGETLTHFPGFEKQGQEDTFVMKIDNAGARQWVQQTGEVGRDRPAGVVTDGKGNVFVGGSSESIFPGRTNLYNRTDVFLMKFNSSGEMY
nr:SBBP repeat-containing protein [Archangium sp. Cb G35]